MKISRILTIAASILIGLSGGVSFSQKIELNESQLEIRSMQTRAFDTTDEITEADQFSQQQARLAIPYQDLQVLLCEPEPGQASVAFALRRRGSMSNSVVARPESSVD